MDKVRILIVGCGDVGCHLASLLHPSYIVYGMRRNTSTLPENIIALAADFTKPETLKNLPAVDILIYCAAPSRNGNDSYQDTYLQGFSNVIKALPNPVKHAFFTSSTSVYAQDDHQWVNEQSPTLAQSPKASIMIAAEQQVLSTTFPSTVVRFSGIYGFDRLHLLNQVLTNTTSPSNKAHYTNRIHVEDCAGVLKHLIDMACANKPLEQIYLASDNRPVLKSQVCRWLAEQTNSQLPVCPSTNTNSGKRCDNQLLIKSGYQFHYPDFQIGYAAIIERLHIGHKTSSEK